MIDGTAGLIVGVNGCALMAARGRRAGLVGMFIRSGRIPTEELQQCAGQLLSSSNSPAGQHGLTNETVVALIVIMEDGTIRAPANL